MRKDMKTTFGILAAARIPITPRHANAKDTGEG